MLSARTTWDVEDNWIVLKGDAVDELILSAAAPDPKVRLASAIQLGKHAVANPIDKRALPVMMARLVDPDGSVRLVAAAAFGVAGWVDATIDPCVRNRLIATLQALADPKVEPNATTRAKASDAVRVLLELGMLDPKFLPISEKCGAVRPGPPVQVGPFVDPSAPMPGARVRTGAKVVVAVAAVAGLAALGYVLLRTPAAPARRRRRRA